MERAETLRARWADRRRQRAAVRPGASREEAQVDCSEEGLTLTAGGRYRRPRLFARTVPRGGTPGTAPPR